MSVHSDDTDVLLLIPPDFFMVPSDEEDDHNKTSEQLLYSDLISQVNDLEGRLCYIENKNTIGDKMLFNDNLKQHKLFGSSDTLSTLCKPNYNTKSFKLTSPKTETLPADLKACKKSLNLFPEKPNKNFKSHPNILMSKEYLNQKEKDDTLLKEIRKFFKVKEALGKEMNLFEECPEIDTDGNLHLFSTVHNLNKVNDLLKKLEETQMEIEEKLKLKGFITTEETIEVSNSIQNEISSFKKSSNIVTEVEDYKKSKTSEKDSNFTSLKPNKSHNKEENDKENLENIDNKKTPSQENNRNSMNENFNNTKFSSELPGVPSLCSLWENNDVNKNSENFSITDDFSIVKQKYQEEQCRRQHCEEVIQRLQALLLEQQQKLAVAIKVDKEKDKVISKLTEGYNKLVNNWEKLEDQKNQVESQLELEREKFEAEVTAACQTVKKYESELSKALGLAHGYKEKCEELENEKKNKVTKSIEETDTLKHEVKYLKEKIETERLKTEKLNKVIAAKEESLNQAKAKILESVNRIKIFEKKLKESETELEIVKLEKENFHKKLKEEHSKNLALEQRKKNLFENNEKFKKNEKCLKENLKLLQEEIEKNKIELKEFYQKQVEQIVQEKLREFQDQLSAAEKTLQKDLEEREKNFKEMAMQQVQQIVQKHVVEINILEEKHREEIELWKVKVIQSEEKTRELQQKLGQYNLHKSEIAQKLQSVMEAQWQEALKIITALSPNSFKKPVNCPENYAGEKSLPRQNTFTVTANILENKNLPEENNKISVSPSKGSFFWQKNAQDDPVFLIDDQSSCHLESDFQIMADDVPQKKHSTESDCLKNYILMLLERPPCTPANEKDENNLDDNDVSDTAQKLKIKQWQQILSERSNQKDRNSNKKNIF